MPYDYRVLAYYDMIIPKSHASYNKLIVALNLQYWFKRYTFKIDYSVSYQLVLYLI